MEKILIQSNLTKDWEKELQNNQIIDKIKINPDRSKYMKYSDDGMLCIIPKDKMGEEFGAAFLIELEEMPQPDQEELSFCFRLDKNWDFKPNGIKLGLGLNFGHPEGNVNQTWSGNRNPESGEGSIRIMLRKDGLYAYIYHDAQLDGEPINIPLGFMPKAESLITVTFIRDFLTGSCTIQIYDTYTMGTFSKSFNTNIKHRLTTITLDVFAGGHPVNKKKDQPWKSNKDRKVLITKMFLFVRKLIS